MIERWTTWFIDQVIEAGECDFAARHRRARRRHAGLARPRRRRLAPLLAGPALRARRLARAARRTRTPSRSTSRGWRSRSRRPSPPAGPSPRDDLISYLLAQEVDGAPITRRRRLLDGRAADLRRRRDDRLPGQPDPGPPRAGTPTSGGSCSRIPTCCRGPSRSSCARSPRPRPWRAPSPRTPSSAAARMKQGDRVLLAWSSANRDPAAVRRPGRRRPHAVAEPAHRVRHGHPPLRRRAPRARDGARAASGR